MRVYIDGQDGRGWHLDTERRSLQDSLRRLGIDEANGIVSADIVHNLCWQTILSDYRFPLIRRKRSVLLTASNFIVPQDPSYALQSEYRRLAGVARAWIAPSLRQKSILEKEGLKVFYQPFYLDLNLFKPQDTGKELLASTLGIPKELVANRVVIGSFQRDSLGTNLTQPKWQKGPELLIGLLKALPRDRFLLLLAGPRRHYVLRECKVHNIPYFYLGRETSEDDLDTNIAGIAHMPTLYAMCDIYLVTSVSEGGPKAVIEAAATKTFILSTDVGLAGDFLNRHNVCSYPTNYAKELQELVVNNARHKERITRDVCEQYERCVRILGRASMDRRLLSIYEEALGA